MKKNLMFLALASLGLGLASCNGGFKQTDGGLLYSIHVDKGGTLIQQGDFIAVGVVAKTDGDSVLFNTYDSGHPIQMLVQKSQYKGDIYTALEKLAEGDSATIKIPADSMFKKGQPKPPGFKGKYFVYDIKVEKVIPKGKLSEQAFEKNINAYLKVEGDAMKKLEPAQIKAYITHEKLTVSQTPDTLYYQITQPGTGPKISVGDTAVVNYTGRLLNGKVFDSSVKDTMSKAGKLDPTRQYKPIHVPVGHKQVIQGLDEGILLLNKGAKAVFVIPSNLAYGERGMQKIGPYTPLAFEIELVDIIHPNPNAPKPPVMGMPVPQMHVQTPPPVKK